MKNGKNSLHYEVTVSKVNLRSGNMKAKAKKKKKTGLRASTGTVESSFFKQKSTQLERIGKILNRMIVLLQLPLCTQMNKKWKMYICALRIQWKWVISFRIDISVRKWKVFVLVGGW